MNKKTFLLSLVAVLVLASFPNAIRSAQGNTPPPWTVSLDADSSSVTDAAVESSYAPSGSYFNIGAIINASSLHPINNVYAWQFSIIYDNRTVEAGSPPVHFGAQTGPGNPNWSLLSSSGSALAGSNIIDNSSIHRKVAVYFTLLGSNPGVSIAPNLSPTIQGNLLASVNFTSLQVPATKVSFNVTDLIFVDASPSHNQISGLTPGPAAVEYFRPDFTITSNPAMLVITQGGVESSTVAVASQHNFTGSISLTSNSISGITVSLTPASVSPPRNGVATSTLNVTVSTSATPGTYAVALTGSNGTTTHTFTVEVQIVASLPTPSSPVLSPLVISGIVIAVALVSVIAFLTRRKKASLRKRRSSLS